MTGPRPRPEPSLPTAEPIDDPPVEDAAGDADTGFAHVDIAPTAGDAPRAPGAFNPGFHIRKAAHIRALPPQVFNQIAAGEVIERPANVVKEALENSLDALATRILVEIEDGGKRLIRISDNGHGIPAGDLTLALSPHATSKLSSADEIANIATFGFRGEALASIASVAEVTLRSRPRPEAWLDTAIPTPQPATDTDTSALLAVPAAAETAEAGAELTVQAGDFQPVRPCGMPVGTILEVRRLFARTPVRLKFLKGTPTELSHVVQVVTRAALAQPGVAIALQHNGRRVCEFHAGETPRERFGGAFGPEADRHALAVASYAPPTEGRVEGFVCNPAHTKPNSGQVWLFLNGRFIRDKALTAAVTQAFRDYVPHGRYPVACLFITLDPRRFDVNVHPQKLEVRFRDPRALFSRILRAVRERLVGALPPQVRLPDAMPVAHRAMVQDLLDAADETPHGAPRVHAATALSATDSLPERSGGTVPDANRTRGALFSMGRGATLPMPFPAVDPYARSEPSAADLDDTAADGSPWGPFPTDRRDATPQRAAIAPAADVGLPPRDRQSAAPSSTAAARETANAGVGAGAGAADAIGALLAALPAFADHPARRDAPALSDNADADAAATRDAPRVRARRPDDAPLSIVQIHNAYIACEYPDRLELIDQHALHERVLFHHLRERFDRGQVERQRLLIAEPLDLLASETALLQEPAVRAAFAKLGFEIGRVDRGDMRDGNATDDEAPDRPRLAIHAVPTLLARRGTGRRGMHGIVEDTLAAMLADEFPTGSLDEADADADGVERGDAAGDGTRDPAADAAAIAADAADAVGECGHARRAPPPASLKTGLSWLRRPYLLLATMACKAACKAGDPLSPAAMRALLSDAATLPDAYACPHGRPTTLTLAYTALDRYFGRSV